jgi:hypothetical protein
MCLETNKIIKIKVVVFMENRGSIKNNLEMHQSERNERHAVMVVDKYFKLSLSDDTRQFVDDNDEVNVATLASSP